VAAVHETTETTQRRLEALGQTVRSLREAAGESQVAAAQALGLNRGFLIGIEAGRRNVSVERLFDIADHYGVAPAALLKHVR
jgi:transcriptional regulator with XRE-family HTH domain